MAETKADRDTRHKHHQTLGGVTHGVHHGVAHGEHGITAHRNVHQNKVKANPHKGGAHGWVYTSKKGDTLQNLQTRAWPGSSHSGKPFGQATSNTNITKYANNAKLLKSQGVNTYNLSNPLRPGTRVIL